MASCCVSVEPPCDDAAMHHVGNRGARDADWVDAVMRIEAAVLDGDERLWQIGRQILQRDIGAGHFAAGGQQAAVDANNLDGRGALWNFQRLDRRQMRADPDHDADDRDRRPQAEHRAPVDQPAEPEPAARFRTPLGAAFWRARLALARRRLVVVLFRLALGHWLLRLVVGGGRNAILRREAQVGECCRKPEQRLLASAALFPSPRHDKRRSHPSRRTLAGAV